LDIENYCTASLFLNRLAYSNRVYPYAIPFLLKIPHQIIYEGNYMARRQILSLSERESLLALPDDELTLTRMAYFSEHDLALISAHRKPASRFGFAVLLCYLKMSALLRIKKSHPLMRC
jgi:hypothetical protein